ncbi:MAG: protease inhibitor I42 family protein [bacterium]|nr:protease inhibitor I42 family protein [bacterium]
MSTRTAHLVLPALLVVAFASWAHPRPIVTELTARDAGSTVTLRVGDSLHVALEGNPTTGYTWGIAAGAGSLLKQEGEPEFEPFSRAIGSSGVFTLRFKAIRHGEVQLKLIYHRTFEPNVPPLRTFEVRLVVRK